MISITHNGIQFGIWHPQRMTIYYGTVMLNTDPKEENKMAAIEIKKENKMDRKEVLKVAMMIGAVIPVFMAAYTLPGLEKYFKTAADQGLIAQAEALDKYLTFGLALFVSWGKGIQTFVKIFPLLVLTDITVALVTAIAGPDQLELRFFAKTASDVIAIGGIGQAINTMAFKVWQGTELQLLANRISLTASIGGIGGATLSMVYNPFTVDQLLWLNVAVAIAAGVFRTATFYALKKEADIIRE